MKVAAIVTISDQVTAPVELGQEDARGAESEPHGLELDGAGVFALVFVVVKEAAARDHVGVDHQAKPVRRAEAELRAGGSRTPPSIPTFSTTPVTGPSVTDPLRPASRTLVGYR